MRPGEPLVLPPDVVLAPVEELPEEVRARVECKAGDFLLSRPQSRASTRILEPDAARLLREFREPCTLVDAVLRFSGATGADPERTLEAAWPLLRGLVEARMLVRAGTVESGRIEPSLEPGARFAGVEILECLQSLEDTEVFRARAPGGALAVLKVARPGSGPDVRRLLEREARILRWLGGEVAPRLLAADASGERAFLLMEWCPGAPPSPEGLGSRWERLEALGRCCALLEAYARLHAKGVIHADVHPGNVLLSAEGQVRVIDFGLARLVGDEEAEAPPRGGVAFFLEPELARAELEDVPPPPASEAGEQHALAALVYWLLTGQPIADFSLERREMLRQLAESAVLPFSARGGEAWPEVERVLGRALSREPGTRYPSVAAFAEALRGVWEAERSRGREERPLRSAGAGAFVESLLDNARPGGAWFESGFPGTPSCSVNFGAAGLALALYRLAGHRQSPELLALSDFWMTRALQRMTEPGALYAPGSGITEREVGRGSLFHTASGLHAVRALIANAMGDTAGVEEALAGFAEWASRPCERLELTLGRAGLLLGCAMLHEAVPSRELRGLGDGLLGGLWRTLDGLGPLRECRELPLLGIAHGWGGVLYATLRWCGTSGHAFPAALVRRLEELAEEGEPVGRGLWWRWTAGGADEPARYMSGWCNGTAGLVFLWSRAHAALGDARWRELAERAGWDVWEGEGEDASLCCGLTGRAYALLHLHRLTGEEAWRERAFRLCERALSGAAGLSRHPGSLYKGALGVALLVAELRADPGAARMPFFEEEGWPPPRAEAGAPGNP